MARRRSKNAKTSPPVHPGIAAEQSASASSLPTSRFYWQFGIVALIAFGFAFWATRYFQTSLPSGGPAGMRWIPAGDFLMGSHDPQLPANEQPIHRVKLPGFWMDEHEVTNAEFAAFVEATGYVTVAERPLVWEEMKKQLPPGTPRPDASSLVPGSLVFSPPQQAVPLDSLANWWRWIPGANWKHPEGPESSIDGRENHPVVHVSWDDAVAYAHWAGKRLPTEAEWEYASRGGLTSQRFPWGNEPPGDNGPYLANIWQGDFPHHNQQGDGFERTAPVGQFPPNQYGLVDMAGNVWEWCSDWYAADMYETRRGRYATSNPHGPTHSLDPNEPYSQKRVTRGGSFLCHVSYCESYRTAARRGTAYDTGMSHLGFRCVMTQEQWDAHANSK